MNVIQQFKLSVLFTIGSASAVVAQDGFILQPKLQDETSGPSAELSGQPTNADPVAPIASQVGRKRQSTATSTPPSQQSPGLHWVTRPHDMRPETRPTEPRIAANAVGFQSEQTTSMPVVSPSPTLREPASANGIPQANTLSTTSPAETSAPLARFQLAAHVSRNTLGEPKDRSRVMRATPLPTGWRSVGERLSRSVSNCEQLLSRQAFYSARQEAEEALVYLLQTIDGANGQYRSEPAWTAATAALDEAEAFTTLPALDQDRSLLADLINSHRTPTLKDVDPLTLIPVLAAEQYREYAQEQLIAAADSHPWASELFYTVGRVYQAQADADDTQSVLFRHRAKTFYRAAVVVDPNNALAANQLGYVLLQLDRPAEAHAYLVKSVGLKLTIPALQNLAEASQRLGDQTTQRWAVSTLTSLQQRTPPPARGPRVTLVPQQTFAAISPYPGSTQASRTSAGQISATPTYAGQPATAR